MEIKETKTDRGFSLLEFKDYYGESCSLQKSSLAGEDAIWFGIDDAHPQILASKVIPGGTGWVRYDIPEDVLLHTRMHLTQAQVEALLPILMRFVAEGKVSKYSKAQLKKKKEKECEARRVLSLRGK